MRKINYSPDSVEKLQKIKVDITEKFGEETALDTIVEMMDTIDLLTENPELGDSVSDMYNIPTEYRRLYVCHNSIIYYDDIETIYIVYIFHEKEDLIKDLTRGRK